MDESKEEEKEQWTLEGVNKTPETGMRMATWNIQKHWDTERIQELSLQGKTDCTAIQEPSEPRSTRNHQHLQKMKPRLWQHGCEMITTKHQTKARR